MTNWSTWVLFFVPVTGILIGYAGILFLRRVGQWTADERMRQATAQKQQSQVSEFQGKAYYRDVHIEIVSPATPAVGRQAAKNDQTLVHGS